MKKTILLLMLFVCIEGYSQISLDFQSSEWLGLSVRLSNTETKYRSIDFENIQLQNQFDLFNLDGSLFKTINLPPNPNPSATLQGLGYITESLFDNDPSNIEFLLYYTWDSSGVGINSQIDIVREDGTVLLSEMDAQIDWWPSNSEGSTIYSTEEGTKLRMMYYHANQPIYQIKVFSLPGEIPTNIIDKSDVNNYSPNIYPNPNAGSFFIKVHSNEEINQKIDLYSTDGKLIKTYYSSENPTQINNLKLPDGIYLINTLLNGINSTNKMIIKK